MLESHYSALLNFFRRRMPSVETAFDLTQETFARVIAAEQTTDITNPRAFLFRTAENLYADYYRKASNRLQGQMDSLNEFDLPISMEALPEFQADQRQRIEQLHGAIARLPERCRQVFILHKFEGYTHVAIAERLGISRNTVEKHIINAMIRLRASLNDKMGNSV